MVEALRRLHLQELKLAEDHVARGKWLLARQHAISHDLRSAGGAVTENAEILLRLLQDSQRLFQSHADMLKRELAREPWNPIASG